MSLVPTQPEILVIPDCRTNREFPSVAGALLSAYWKIPVVDFNTVKGNEKKRLAKPAFYWGMVALSNAASEMYRVSELLNHQSKVSWATANGPIDIQCCYPFLKTTPNFSFDRPFDDDLPFPDYSLFDTFDFILNKWQMSDWFYPIMTSLGCPFGCVYCASKKRNLQFRSIQHCIYELKEAKEKWRIKRFVVIDDCFNADIERAKRFSEAVLPLKMEWMAGNGLRADRFDKELGRLMQKSGCRWISFGVESTDNKVLESIRKGEKFEQIDKAVSIASKIIDYVNVFLILGLPESSYETDKASIAWAKTKNVGTHISFYVPFDEKMQFNCLFDSNEGRKLPDTYDENLQFQLYKWAKE